MSLPKNKFKIILFIFLSLDGLMLLYLLIGHNTVALLEPKGIIAFKERQLIIAAVLLMSVVVVPVLGTAFFFAKKYSVANKEATYEPDQVRKASTTIILWLIPSIIIFFVAILIWKSSHELDPYKNLDSSAKPITIQVVALNWKWLFIYPDYNIATVNFIEFPKNTPLNFKLTADAPMNTFWIPQLGGQVYAMAGMETQLNLMASEEGEFSGSSSEINGKGYAGMRFKAKAVTESEFDLWVKNVKGHYPMLNSYEYGKLAEESINNPPAYYSSTQPELYNTIIMKPMKPSGQ